LRERPDFQRIPTTNILRTGLHARIKSIQNRETPAIVSRTRATMTNKWIARAFRVSAHSDHKHSKDLRARPDQINPEPRAAQREAVELFP